jgi:hypothetical protein
MPRFPSRWSAGVVAAAAALPLVAVLVAVVASIAGPATAGPSTTQIVAGAPTTVSSSTTGPGFGQATAYCPAGTEAVGGGVDVSDPAIMEVTSDGPVLHGKGIFALDGGADGGSPQGWEVSALNYSVTAHAVYAVAICEELDANVAPVHTYTIVGTAGATALSDSAACPSGTVEIAGGVDTADHHSVYIDDSYPIGSTPNPSGASLPTGWAADVRGGQFVIGVLCADQQGNGKSQPTMLFDEYQGIEAPGDQLNTLISQTCPAGDEATAGGVQVQTPGVGQNEQSMAQSAPLQGGNLPNAAGPGQYPPASQWDVSAFNYGPKGEAVFNAFVICVGAPPPPTTTTTTLGSTSVQRLAGTDRIATAIAVSNNSFPQAGTAQVVVLSRDDSFADALAGTPLAVHKQGPLLLTETGSLDPRTDAEIQRVLSGGGTVYILGGSAAVSPGVDTELENEGYKVVRLAGADRFDTAVQIASVGLGDPTTVVEATGLDFPDALAAGAAAGAKGDALLLTNGSVQDSYTATYLAAHPADTRVAVGGAAAAADPGATPIVGSDRYATAVLVAQAFIAAPNVVGAASGTNYPDALTGGANAGLQGGPLILVPASGPLPTSVDTYLKSIKVPLGVLLFGGTAAVGSDVQTEMAADVS